MIANLVLLVDLPDRWLIYLPHLIARSICGAPNTFGDVQLQVSSQSLEYLLHTQVNTRTILLNLEYVVHAAWLRWPHHTQACIQSLHWGLTHSRINSLWNYAFSWDLMTPQGIARPTSPHSSAVYPTEGIHRAQPIQLLLMDDLSTDTHLRLHHMYHTTPSSVSCHQLTQHHDDDIVSSSAKGREDRCFYNGQKAGGLLFILLQCVV
jgi:hypothetical protein